MPDWKLDMVADAVGRLIEAENNRTRDMMANMQKSYMETMPTIPTTQPRDLFSRTNTIPHL